MAEEEDTTYVYKIVLLGDTGVGKTNIVSQFIRGQIPKSTTPTIGVEFATKIMTIKNNKKVKAQIWDTAGQERYRSITSGHYRKAFGALLVYDVTREKTFQNIPKWVEELRFHAGNDIKILLIGNKVDLTENDERARRVPEDVAAVYAQENGMSFKETSAKSNKNITESFQHLLESIYDDQNARSPPREQGRVISMPNSTTDLPGTNSCKC